MLKEGLSERQVQLILELFKGDPGMLEDSVATSMEE
jgi:hypothetical protein